MKTSNMDYEKKYKEALEKIRSLHRDYNQISTLIDVKEELENIFPELAESEDEKIKRVIMNVITKVNYSELDGLIPDTIRIWLEKQGEQKPAEWSEDDIIRTDTLSTFVKLFGTGYYQKFEIEGVVDWIKSLKDRVQPQPKQEWNEEDSRLINEVIELIDAGSLDRKEKDDYIERLKSLKPQSHWKPSEEQMKMLEKIIDTLSQMQLFGGRNALMELKHDLNKLTE